MSPPLNPPRGTPVATLAPDSPAEAGEASGSLPTLAEAERRHIRTPARQQVPVQRENRPPGQDHGPFDEGSFRSDLYYRLNVIPLTVPPLRERRSDIPLLVQLFLERFTKYLGKSLEGVSPETMEDVLRISEAPIIASHSNARSIADHARNVPDEILRRLPDNGGVVMVNFYSGFVVPEATEIVRDMFEVRRRLRAEHGDDEAAYQLEWKEWQAEHPIPRGSVGDLVDHIDRIVQVAGVDHVGLGSDFDGVSVVPEGLEDVSTFTAVTDELLRRGYSDEDVIKILGGNLLRALGQAENVARRLQAAPTRF